jgi:proteic killer suppression protein
VIRTFADRRTVRLFEGEPVRGVSKELRRIAQRRLEQLHAAATIDMLRIPPGNRLEKLKGDRAGQWSIRDNDQWRICFTWRDGDAFDVWFGDYHG